MLCVLVLVAFVFSTQRHVAWHSARLRHGAGLALGALWYAWRPAAWRLETDRYLPEPGWTIASYGDPPETLNLAWWVERRVNRAWEWLGVPLWMPFLLVGVATGMLWRRDRHRRTPGHCARCGYDLTGNVSGRCPECGVEITQKR